MEGFSGPVLRREAGLAACLTMLVGANCAFAETKLERALRRLEPQTRFRQVCDLEAMKRISADESNPYKPDRAMIDAYPPRRSSRPPLRAWAAPFAAAESGISSPSRAAARPTT
jgi:hypothetical protein